MKVYPSPRECPGGSAVLLGESEGGAINPKTLQKWVWHVALHQAKHITELADEMVSLFIVIAFTDP